MNNELSRKEDGERREPTRKLILLVLRVAKFSSWEFSSIHIEFKVQSVGSMYFSFFRHPATSSRFSMALMTMNNGALDIPSKFQRHISLLPQII